MDDKALMHFGVLGMRWGVSKGYSKTEVAQARGKMSRGIRKSQTKQNKKISKEIRKATVGVVTLNKRSAKKHGDRAQSYDALRRTDLTKYAALMVSNKSMQRYMASPKSISTPVEFTARGKLTADSILSKKKSYFK